MASACPGSVTCTSPDTVLTSVDATVWGASFTAPLTELTLTWCSEPESSTSPLTLVTSWRPVTPFTRTGAFTPVSSRLAPRGTGA